MSATLTTCKTQLAIRLQDTSNLVYSTSTLEEAIAAALAELSSSYGAAVTLNGLDGAAATTFSNLDLHTLLVGAEAYCYQYRLIGKTDEANPTREDLSDLADRSAAKLKEFQSLLHHIRMRRFQESSDHPYTQWEWEEGEDFA